MLKLQFLGFSVWWILVNVLAYRFLSRPLTHIHTVMAESATQAAKRLTTLSNRHNQISAMFFSEKHCHLFMMIQADANNTANESRNHFKHSTDCDHLASITRGSASSARIVEYSGEQTCESFMSFLFFARQFPRTHHFKVPRAIALHIALTKKSTKTNRHKMIMMTKTTSALSRWSVDWNPSASAKHPDPYVTITAAQ